MGAKEAGGGGGGKVERERKTRDETPPSECLERSPPHLTGPLSNDPQRRSNFDGFSEPAGNSVAFDGVDSVLIKF